MPSLPELQRRFAGDLARPREGEPRGLAVYRHAIAANYRRALGATFPVVRRLAGETFFDAAVDEFVAAHPPASGDLNVYGDGFGRFLASYARTHPVSCLAGLARLEWAIDEASRAADSDVTPAEVVASIGAIPEDAVSAMRLALHPSCRFVASPVPLFEIWRMHQPGYAGEMNVDLPHAAPEWILVRRVGEGVGIEPCGAGELAWLQALSERHDFGAALARALEAQPAFDLPDTLQRRVHDGTIRGVEAADQSSVM